MLPDWEADTWIAVSTFALATATVLLALFTWRLSGITASEAAAYVKPLLVNAQPKVSGAVTSKGVDVFLRIRNIGAGPAPLTDHREASAIVGGNVFTPSVRPSATAIPLDEVVQVTIAFVPGSRALFAALTRLDVTLVYTDSNGRQPMKTTFRVGQRDGDLVFERVEIFTNPRKLRRRRRVASLTP
jgi:hypothetical protein